MTVTKPAAPVAPDPPGPPGECENPRREIRGHTGRNAGVPVSKSLSASR
jgi:hypothetical protein